MWDGLRKAAEGLLSEDAKAKAAGLARRAHEAAVAAADRAGQAHKGWMEARADAAAAQRDAELAEGERQRVLGEEHGFAAHFRAEIDARAAAHRKRGI